MAPYGKLSWAGAEAKVLTIFIYSQLLIKLLKCIFLIIYVIYDKRNLKILFDLIIQFIVKHQTKQCSFIRFIAIQNRNALWVIRWGSLLCSVCCHARLAHAAPIPLCGFNSTLSWYFAVRDKPFSSNARLHKKHSNTVFSVWCCRRMTSCAWVNSYPSQIVVNSCLSQLVPKSICTQYRLVPYSTNAELAEPCGYSFGWITASRQCPLSNNCSFSHSCNFGRS